MVMHAIANGGCTGTVRGQSALKVDSASKIIATPGTRTRISIAPGFSVGRFTGLLPTYVNIITIMRF